ncbi:hypothetical protein CALCODRAFT_224968 [Calocera cornea HHB12733]|uniref:DUF6533 domain-containing protein n=1 Tax=Calocera cornea HHB12733 TaxID=1353952 RepID=A0A165H6C6_9BASI|nr:hypothetical protein CALCODRAFT_224968 [Calocera cornea HHB12733]
MDQYSFVPTIVSRYASTILLLHDIFITLDDEIAYVWSAKWAFPKFLYLWVRYPTLFNQVLASILTFFPLSNTLWAAEDHTLFSANSFESCFAHDLFYSSVLLSSAACTDGLLLLRVLALVKGRRAVNLTLRIIYIVIYLVLAALLFYYYFAITTGARDWSTNLGCIQTLYSGGFTSLTAGTVLIPIATAPILVLNSILLGVLIWVVVPASRRESTRTPLFSALIRDGVMYYVLILAINLTLIVTGLIYYNSPRAVAVAEPWFLSVGPIAATRLFLNLRTTMSTPRSGRRIPPRSPSIGTVAFTIPSSSLAASTSPAVSSEVADIQATGNTTETA